MPYTNTPKAIIMTIIDNNSCITCKIFSITIQKITFQATASQCYSKLLTMIVKLPLLSQVSIVFILDKFDPNLSTTIFNSSKTDLNNDIPNKIRIANAAW